MIVKFLKIAISILCLLVLTAGCNSREQQKQPLTIAAATGLRFALEEVATLYREQHGQEVVYVFGSTGDLARQIKSGAPVDLFLSADRLYMDELIDAGLIEPGSTCVFAVGQIVLAVNKAEQPPVASLQNLAEYSGPIALANPDHAPYGRAAREALQAAGLWNALQEQIIYGETVGQVLQFIQTGNAPVGIIALSLADVPEIEYRLIDSALYSPLEQVSGIVAGSPRAGAARGFAHFLNGDSARRILEQYGFTVPLQ
ncbi:MAG: molybdate ABC transporter substrate-binding protein [Bacillota bacterium]